MKLSPGSTLRWSLLLYMFLYGFLLDFTFLVMLSLVSSLFVVLSHGLYAIWWPFARAGLSTRNDGARRVAETNAARRSAH